MRYCKSAFLLIRLFLFFYVCVFVQVSHKIVEHHHGTLRVHSEGEGHGTTMTVELPAKRFLTTDAANVAYDNMISEMESQNIQSLQVQPSESSIVSPYDSDKELNLGTLLFAEDVKLNRKMVKKSLNASFTEIIEVFLHCSLF